MRIYYVNSLMHPKRWNLHFLSSLQAFSEIIISNINKQDIAYEYNEDSESILFHYSERVLEDIKLNHVKKKIDIFISSFTDVDIDASLISQIKKMDILTINLNMDKYYGIFHSKKIAPFFDYILISNKKYKKEILNINSNPIHLELAANPFYFYPQKMDKIYDVSFSGNWDLYRDEKVNFLLKKLSKKITLSVFGNGWKKNKFFSKLFINLLSKINLSIPLEKRGKFLDYFDYLLLFSQSRISINISEKIVEKDHFEEDHVISKVSLRDFEAPMSGAFYITKYDSDLEECFENYKEVVFYSTYEHLLDLIRFYFNNPSECERIRKNGYYRSINEHTWYNRIEEMFKQIGIKQKYVVK